MVRSCVTITLWCLATPCEHATGDHIFHVHHTCRVISLVFPREFLVFPTENELTEVIDALLVLFSTTMVL